MKDNLMTGEASRLLCRVDEIQWSDSLVWGSPRIQPQPTVRPGAICRLQLWMSPDEFDLVEIPNRAAATLDKMGPRYALSGPLSEVAMDSSHSDLGRRYVLLDFGYPIILILSIASREDLEALVDKAATARGIVQADISIWTGPIFHPVDVKVESITELSGGD